MLEELQRRNLSPITTRIYLQQSRSSRAYYKASPDQLGPKVREYQGTPVHRSRRAPLLSANNFLLCDSSSSTRSSGLMADDLLVPSGRFACPKSFPAKRWNGPSRALPVPASHSLILYATCCGEELVRLKVGDIDSADGDPCPPG